MIAAMDGLCFKCDKKNSLDQAYCGSCGSPLALNDFISTRVDSRLTEATSERELVEKESALRIFEKAYGWAKLFGGIATGLAALLIAGATWLSLDLRSSVITAKRDVETAKHTAETSIAEASQSTKDSLSLTSSRTTHDISAAANAVLDSSHRAQEDVKAQRALITSQAEDYRRDFQREAAAVTRDVSAARQQIQAANQLQPQMLALQKQLSDAQSEIKDQQKVITSSADFAKKIFSSHKRITFDFKTMDKSQYAVIEGPKTPDGIQVLFLYVIIPETPVEDTLEPQFPSIVTTPGAFGFLHNLVYMNIAKGIEKEIMSGRLTINYFPDPEDRTAFHKLTSKDGKTFADTLQLPFAVPEVLPASSKSEVQKPK